MPQTTAYWQQRYLAGGNSGDGSHRPCLVRFKAEVVNALVREFGIRSVIDFGCGDGDQLAHAEYPEYLGLDVSSRAVALCRERFHDDRSKRFAVRPEGGDGSWSGFDMALSLDVIFHLIDDLAYKAYLRDLFSAATKLVVVYSSNHQAPASAPHVRHRRFTDWTERLADWRLLRHVPQPYPGWSFSDFWIFAPQRLHP